MLIEEIRNIKSTRKDLRNFGLTIGILLAVIGAFLFWKEKGSYPIFVITGMVCILSGLVIPVILKPVHKVWMTFAVIIGWFMTRVILCTLFFLILTPIGLIARLSGKQFLELKIDKSRESYWNRRELRDADKGEYTKQF